MDEKVQLIAEMEIVNMESSNNVIGLREYYGDAWNTAFSTIEEVNQILSGYHFSILCLNLLSPDIQKGKM